MVKRLEIKSTLVRKLEGELPSTWDGVINIDLTQLTPEDLKKNRYLVVNVYKGTYDDAEYELESVEIVDKELESEEEYDKRQAAFKKAQEKRAEENKKASEAYELAQYKKLHAKFGKKK